MAKSAVSQTFIPGPRLIDGSDLNTAVSQINNNLATDVIIIPISALAGLANSQVRKIAMPSNFTVNSVGFRVGTPVTTAAKAATLQAQISGVACTGGAISLTSANCTPTGAAVAGTAITAANTGAGGATLEVAVSGVTAFVEGDGYVEFNITYNG